jgi:sugar/nucleoside kinase (ribokinase family)
MVFLDDRRPTTDDQTSVVGRRSSVVEPTVLCYGALCADHRMYLPRFPRPGDGMRISEERWTPGGNALNEALALQNWGWQVALAGDRLGTDQAGDLVWERILAAGIDHSQLKRDPQQQTTICRILLTPDGERTILALRNAQGAFDLPSPEFMAQVRAVSLSRYGPGGAEEMGRMARAAGRLLVIGDISDPADPLAQLAQAICVSAAGLQAGGTTALEERIVALQAACGGAVFVSDGPRAAQVFWREDGVLQSHRVTPPQINVRDTIGAGDTFRGAVTDGLLRYLSWPHILEHAVERASQAILKTSLQGRSS